jgi:putative RNA 2'-phosphotransferase
LVLRDDSGGIHLTLDSDGWADVQNLLTRANRYGFKLTREDLSAVMLDPEEHRFEWDQSGDRIRWSKG